MEKLSFGLYYQKMWRSNIKCKLSIMNFHIKFRPKQSYEKIISSKKNIRKNKLICFHLLISAGK